MKVTQKYTIAYKEEHNFIKEEISKKKLKMIN